MKTVDPGIYMVIGIVVLIVIFWKPIYNSFEKVTGGKAHSEQVARGKQMFYDTERWGGKGSYMSCAMCHASDFKPDPAKHITMADYRPGQPYSLKGEGDKNGSLLTGDDDLLNAINNCLGQPSRMNVGRVASTAPFLPDLEAYVKSL